MGEYRRTYQQKFMQVRKNKENKEFSKNFETWKKQTKEKISLMKKANLLKMKFIIGLFDGTNNMNKKEYQ